MGKSVAIGAMLLVTAISGTAVPGVAASAEGTTPAVRIDAGSGTATTVGGLTWSADTYADGGQVRVSPRTVTGTTTPVLYRSVREGMRAYSVPVADGTYAVTFKMAETSFRTAGKRLFDVSLEGRRVLASFDVLAAAGGRDRAVDRTFTTTVTDGRLDVTFNGVRDVPSIAALEVVPVTAAAAPAPVWADEFSGGLNALPDPSRWTYDWGGLGWGDDELQEYTQARSENASTDGAGALRLTARKESLQNAWSNGAEYTSARITTADRFAFTYGRVEVRAKVPSGKGIWPAAWLLGTDTAKLGWPARGEIDVFELINDATSVHSTVHGATTTGGHWSLGAELPRAQTFADGYHLYVLDWRPDALSFSVDGITVGVLRKADMPTGGVWPFDKPHYFLLNLAVGGSWPGAPDATTPFPAQMLVDYVRIYA